MIFDLCDTVYLLHPIINKCPCVDSSDAVKRLFPCAQFNYMYIEIR